VVPQPETVARRSKIIALTFVVVVTGGMIGWTAFYEGLGGWGLLVGLVVTSALVVWVSVRRPHYAGLIGGFAFAFLVLTWPVLWLVVGYVRYLFTGEPIEND
jgi:hypothetical protein